MQRPIDSTAKYRKTKKGVLTNMYCHMKYRKKVEFTLKEFHQRYLDDKKFNRLFNEWVMSGYKTIKKPSIYRIDSRKDYTMDNINMLTWEENRFKQSKLDGKRGQYRPIIQLKNGIIINRFNSQKEAIRKLGCHQGNLSSALNGKYKTTMGYEFKFENPELLKG